MNFPQLLVIHTVKGFRPPDPYISGGGGREVSAFSMGLRALWSKSHPLPADHHSPSLIILADGKWITSLSTSPCCLEPEMIFSLVDCCKCVFFVLFCFFIALEARSFKSSFREKSFRKSFHLAFLLLPFFLWFLLWQNRFSTWSSPTFYLEATKS